MRNKIREERFQKIIEIHGDNISSQSDIIGDGEPSSLCMMLGAKYRKLYDDIGDDALRREIRWRKMLHPLIKLLLPHFLASKQIIENREALKKGVPSEDADPGIILPEKPVIWMANHGFHDDIAAALNAAYRHSYFYFASLPQFYNTFDGVSAYLNGIVLMNRKVKKSRESSVRNVIRVMRQGVDMLIFPEGVWNKTPNLPILPFWPGIYRICKETNAKIVPVVHYIREPAKKFPGNYIHTVVDDPIDLEGLSEKAALDHLRDVMATWYYLMMERYGRSTREKELRGFTDSCSAWEHWLTELIETADYYDREIELKADYRSKTIIRPEDAFGPIANIKNVNEKNIQMMLNAGRIVAEQAKHDFQRLF